MGMWLAAGVAMAALGYFVGDNSLLFFFAGLAIGAPSLFLAARWTWHFSLQLKQLSGLEAKVRAGELVPIRDMSVYVYGARKSA